MDVGISTACLYPMETESAFQILYGLGCRTFELFINCREELEPGFLAPIRRLARRGEITVTSLHPYTSAFESMLLFGDYPRRTKEGFSFYREYLEAAASLGAGLVVLHGQRKGHGKLADEEYWERFGELYRLGESIGAVPAQENVREHKSSEPGFIAGMRRYLGDECAFTLDVKQCGMSGVPVEEMRQAMGPALRHVHLSDCATGKPCLLPGEGERDFSALHQSLMGMGYRGKAVIEVYRDNFVEPKELQNALKITKNLFK